MTVISCIDIKHTTLQFKIVFMDVSQHLFKFCVNYLRGVSVAQMRFINNYSVYSECIFFKIKLDIDYK